MKTLVRHGDPEAIAEPDTYPDCDQCLGSGTEGGARVDDCTRCHGTGIEPPE